jgi:hypothetical protein
MADEELATKAPENDAVKQSPFPNDSIAQEGASMGVRHLDHSSSFEGANI